MAIPVGFVGANHIMYAPPDATPEECVDLPVQRAPGQLISCWRLSPAEVAEINRTGVVWLSVIGRGMPPIKVAGDGLFEDGNPKAEPVMPRARREQERQDNV